jgi:hypothetical protein
MSTLNFGLAHRRMVEGEGFDKEKRVRRAECGPSFRLGWMAAQGGKLTYGGAAWQHQLSRESGHSCWVQPGAYVIAGPYTAHGGQPHSVFYFNGIETDQRGQAVAQVS